MLLSLHVQRGAAGLNIRARSHARLAFVDTLNFLLKRPCSTDLFRQMLGVDNGKLGEDTNVGIFRQIPCSNSEMRCVK
jgi:hypothetical protein